MYGLNPAGVYTLGTSGKTSGSDCTSVKKLTRQLEKKSWKYEKGILFDLYLRSVGFLPDNRRHVRFVELDLLYTLLRAHHGQYEMFATAASVGRLGYNSVRGRDEYFSVEETAVKCSQEKV